MLSPGALSGFCCGSRSDTVHDAYHALGVDEVRDVENTLPENKRMGMADKKHSDKFWQRVYLSLRVSIFICLFGAPTIDSKPYTIVFGDQVLCNHRDSGWQTVNDEQVWCGVLPNVYAACWPTVVAMIIYTVTPTCGNTIRLAWQGVVGTFAAVANMWLMLCIWPRGALTEGYMEWACWIDVVGVMLVFFASGCETNTINFGLSWHAYFMMSFMNRETGPAVSTQWLFDSEASATFWTACIGAFVAILVTLVPLYRLPRPGFEIELLTEKAKKSIAEMCDNWEHAIRYVCSNHATCDGRALALEMRVGSSTVLDMESALNMSWFECFGKGDIQRKRVFHSFFVDKVRRVAGLMLSSGETAKRMTFDDEHRAFFHQGMKTKLLDSHAAGTELYSVLVRVISLDLAGEEAEKEVHIAITKLREAGCALKKEYVETFKTIAPSKVLQPSLNPYIYFLFAFSRWCRVPLVLASKFSGQHPSHTKNPDILDASSIWLQTFGKHVLLKNRIFAIQHTLSMSVAFWIGLNWHRNFFVQYSSTMPASLALMFTHYAGSSVEKSFNRFLGVAAGKIIPIIMLGVADMGPCNSWSRFFWRMLAIAIYMFVLQYTRLASKRYSGPACLAAAFGANMLFIPCEDHIEGTFTLRYEEIGQIMFAIFIDICFQSLFEGVFALISPGLNPPVRVQCVDALKDLSKKSQEWFKMALVPKTVLEQRENIKSGLCAWSEALVQADLLIAESDPQLQLVEGKKCDFKHHLYKYCVNKWSKVYHDASIYYRALHNSPSNNNIGDRLLTEMARTDAIKVFREPLLKDLGDAFDICCGVLGNHSHGPYDGPEIEHVRWKRKEELKNVAEKAAAIRNDQGFADDNDETCHILSDMYQVRISVMQFVFARIQKCLYDICDECVAMNS